MARVTLTLKEIGPGCLPPVCICCGERQVTYQGRNFLVPWWRYAWLRWTYAAVVGVAVLTLNYWPAGMEAWVVFAVLNLGIWFAAWCAVSSNLNPWLLVQTPLCQDHERYWQRHDWWQNQGLPLLAGIPLLALWVWAMMLHYLQPVPWARQVVECGDDLVLLGFFSAASSVGLQGCKEALAIHPTAITRKTVTLVGVCEEFVEAVNAQRHMHDNRG